MGRIEYADRPCGTCSAYLLKIIPFPRNELLMNTNNIMDEQTGLFIPIVRAFPVEGNCDDGNTSPETVHQYRILVNDTAIQLQHRLGILKSLARQDSAFSPCADTTNTKEGHSYESSSSSGSEGKRKRRTKIACVPCYRSKVSCKDQTPCPRCVRLGQHEQCVRRVHRPMGRPRKQNYESIPGTLCT